MNGTSEDLRALFERHDSFLLTAHVSPDGDALGSLAALSLWLKGQGKKVVTVIDDSIDDKFFFIEECQHILRPSDVEAEAGRIGVVLDATDPSRTGETEKLLGDFVVNIDHHVSNAHFADCEYILTDCAATGEILTDLFFEVARRNHTVHG